MNGPSLRVLPTLTGGVLGVGLGSLMLSGVCANRPEPDGLELLAFAAALWAFVAAAMFAANEGWRGRSLPEAVMVFGSCLGLALAMLLLPWVLFTVAAMILMALGGHL
jgi:hypothetical protein